jgi:nucleotide-binding universal stress UspA family protein
VTVRTIDTVPGGTGPALPAVAAEENADWMVMGAYGYLRPQTAHGFLLGEVTRHVLANATLPILMSH